MTVAADNRPNGEGGTRPISAQFREVLAQQGLAEIGPSDRRFTWRGPTSQSRLDCFLCSIEMLANFPLAEETFLLRRLSDGHSFNTSGSWESLCRILGQSVTR